MTVVEVRRGTERDEELAAVGVRSGVGHRQDAGLAVAQRRVEFVGELVAGASRAGAERITPLDHEAIDDAMEDDAVVELAGPRLAGLRVLPFFRPLGKPDEVGDGLGGFLLEQPDREGPLGGIEQCVSAGFHRGIIVRYSRLEARGSWLGSAISSLWAKVVVASLGERRNRGKWRQALLPSCEKRAASREPRQASYEDLR